MARNSGLVVGISLAWSLFFLLFSCGGGGAVGSTTVTPPTNPPPAGVPLIGHVFLLVEENHSYSSVIGNSAMPYLNSLASAHGVATNYSAGTHPSTGNYFMLTTGQILTNDDSSTVTVTADNLARELIASGKSWKSYAESLPSVGYTGGDVYPYFEHHNPFSYFSDVRGNSAQLENLVPFTKLASDLASDQLPNFGYIAPNAEHDAHDCPDGTQNCSDDVKLSTTDAWLQANIGPLLASAEFQQDGPLVIVFDESVDSDTGHGGGQVAMVVISPKARSSFESGTLFQHESTLRMLVEATQAAAFPGASASAPDMGGFFA